MKKYKVKYYEHVDIIEKEIEADKFDIKENTNGMSATFCSTGYDNEKTFAFSNFISIEKID